MPTKYSLALLKVLPGRLLALVARYAGLVVLAVGVLTVAAGLYLPQLQVHLGASGMMAEDHPARRVYDELQGRFPEREGVVLFLRDPQLFTPPALAVAAATIQAVRELPFVARVDSLFDLQQMESHAGEITRRVYLDPLPATDLEARDALRALTANPLMVRNLVAADGSAMAAWIELKPSDTAVAGDQEALRVRALDATVAAQAGALAEAFAFGPAHVRVGVVQRIRADQQTLLPWSLAALVLSLALFLRRWQGAVIPVITAGVSIVWTLGLMAMLGVPMSVMTSMVPALLVIIGSTEDIHLLAEYFAGRAAGQGRARALDGMAAHMGIPLVLTFTTTYLGFLSIATNDISLLREFGLVASTGMALNFLATLLLVPALLQLLPERDAGGIKVVGAAGGLGAWVYRAVVRVHRHPRLLTGTLVGLFLAACAGAWSVAVNNDPMDHFPPGSDVRMKADALHSALAGTNALTVVIRSPIKDTFTQAGYLRQVQELQFFIEGMGLFDKVLSFADLVAWSDALIEESDPRLRRLPEDDLVIREYLNFMGEDSYGPYLTPDATITRIVIRHGIGSSRVLLDAAAQIEAYAREHLAPGLVVTVTGTSMLNALGAEHIARGQAESLMLMVIVIWAIVALLFLDMRAGLVAVVANVFTIGLLFGVMGVLGIALDTGTAMVAAIALGICVDDTVHFMVRYHREMRRLGDEGKALEHTVREEALPIVGTSLALAAGFGVLALSSFPGIAHFGLLSAMVMLFALVATFVITPLLLTRVHLISLWDVLALHLHTDVLGTCRLFRGMRPWQIKKVILVGEIRPILAGETLVHVGESGAEMYILLDGVMQVEIEGADGGGPQVGPGEIVGELALVSGAPRAATVRAISAGEVLVLRWEHIERIGRRHPRIAAPLFLNLARVVSSRLR